MNEGWIIHPYKPFAEEKSKYLEGAKSN